MIKITQTLAVRVFHTLNLIALWFMIGSGLQIYAANPVFGGREGWPGFSFLRIGGWLAGGRHWHFFFMWIFAFNMLAYGVYLLGSKHWRHRYPSLQDIKALQRSQNPQRKNYALHRLTLLALVLVLLLSLYTGLGMYKPLQLGWILTSIGDWQALRISHFLPVVLLPLFMLIHVRQAWVIGGWQLIQSIIVDAYRSRPRRS
jgi:thiosulfate reductase cytochrome b subunit